MRRNLSLDIFKLFLCALVIIIHIPAPLLENHEIIDWLLKYGITRVAVPLFFIIGGYYFGKKINDIKVLRKYIIHLCIIYAVWYLIYIPFDLEHLKVDGEIRLFNIFTSITFGFGHLWYVPALIVGSITLYIAKRVLKNDKLIAAIAILILIATTAYSLSVNPFEISIKSYRNGLFFGFPFIVIGYCIRRFDLINKINKSLVIILSILSLLLLLGESYYLHEIKTFSDLLFSLTLFCPIIFILVMKFSREAVYGEYMSELPGGVYFVHKLPIIFIPMPGNNLAILPVIFFISIILSFIIIFVNKRVRIFL